MKLQLGMLASLALLTGLGTAAAASGGESPPTTSSASQDELRARTVEFSRAIIDASSNSWSPESVARIADFYAIDTVVFPPRGEPLRGRQAQMVYWGSRDRQFLSHSAVAERIDVSGDLATEWGTLTIATRQGTGPSIVGKATYVSIWTRREGVWRKLMDTWW